jgi:thioredoxin reductase
MSNTHRGLPITSSRIEQIFPKLTPAQIRRIAAHGHVHEVLPQTEIVDVEGGNHLNSIYWRNSQTGQTEKHEISHIFVMTGADPNTHWLDGCVALDAKGFIKTGPDLLPENLNAAGWPLTRQPYLHWINCDLTCS